MLTMRDIRAKMHMELIDGCSIRNGVVTIRIGFFYTHGRTTQTWVDKVKESFPTATIVDSGEVWKPFKGGASLKAQSHWFVKFTVPE